MTTQINRNAVKKYFINIEKYINHYKKSNKKERKLKENPQKVMIKHVLQT